MIPVEIVIIAFALATDAFAVAASYSLASRERALRTALVYGAFFGTFQFFMPLAGYLLHMILPAGMLAYSNWIAFALLFIIGTKMVEGYLSGRNEPGDNALCGKPIALPELVALSFATSIDALAAGTSLALIDANILSAAATIGVVAFAMSAVGSLLGCKASGLLGHSELLGGVVLISIAVRILIF